jgi:hypothetical protein
MTDGTIARRYASALADVVLKSGETDSFLSGARSSTTSSVTRPSRILPRNAFWCSCSRK